MSRRTLVLSALIIQGAVLLLALVGAPFELRLPVGLVYAFAVPGFAVIGLLRLADASTELALSATLSVALCTLVAQALIWLEIYSLTLALAVLLVPSCVGLLLQLRAEPARSRGA